jgi:type II secretion system protein N
VFLIVFDLALPYARFKDVIASQVSRYGYDMEARYAGPSLGFGMTIKDIALVSRPTGTSKPTRVLIDKAKVGVSILSYLWGRRAVSVTADVFAGRIDADVNVGKSDSGVTVEVVQIDLSEIPWLKSAINLPASGKLDVKLNLALPKQRLRESKGLLVWDCGACAIGDGKAKLVVASNPILAEGLGLPKIRLGDFSGKVVLDKGVGRLQGVQLKSPDLEATVEGEIHLAEPLAASHVDLYVRFRVSESLLRSSEKLRTIMDFTAQMGKRPDGFIGARMSGTLQSMNNVEWMKSSPFTNAPVLGRPAPRPGLPPPHPPVALPPAVAAAERVAAAPPAVRVAATPSAMVAPSPPAPPSAPVPAPAPVAPTPAPVAPPSAPVPPEALLPPPSPAPSTASTAPPTAVPVAAGAPTGGPPSSSPPASAAAGLEAPSSEPAPAAPGLAPLLPPTARDEARHAASEHVGGLPSLPSSAAPPASLEEEAAPSGAAAASSGEGMGR